MTREEAKKILKAIRVYECYPKSASEETKEAIDMAIEALKEQTATTIKLNNQIHLCDSCISNYPNCPAENKDVLFGNGVGNDNICCCAKYLVSVDRPHG
jgi:hypothetical protein